MTNPVVSCGFVPLVDAAPLIIAKELGFAAQEGINLELHAQPSWSALRDKLAFGAIDAAHMLAPLPIAMSLGLSGYKTRIDVLSVLSMNGNSIGVSNALFERIQFSDVNDAEGAGKAVIAAA
ncbi:MAG TPA: ABC transporter substrate-binding protein, partial [Paracoccaceae bacterium]|nr:ABC transporter substrate-binding protein [Paracoccaceae bacterium]